MRIAQSDAQLEGEDPFAIHILAQSAEKVVIDLLKANGIPDPFHSLIIPARRAEFFESYREPVNFLKHADKDHDGLLPVYDIVRQSDLALLGTIVRLMYLGEQPTSHMRYFLIFVATQFPNTINVDAMPGLADIISYEHARKTTRGELAADLLAAMELDANCQQERAIDLDDAPVANNRLLLGTE